MLNKKNRLSKFESKTIEGILVGYGANSHSYRAFNKSTRCVYESSDVRFNESNGTLLEHIEPSIVGDENPSQAIKNMAIGEIIPIHEATIP